VELEKNIEHGSSNILKKEMNFIYIGKILRVTDKNKTT
jgi:hypothetical protein